MPTMARFSRICGKVFPPGHLRGGRYALPGDIRSEPSSQCRRHRGRQTRLSLGLRLHWIKEWNVNTGLTDEHVAAIKNTLSQGWPVCGGFRWPKQERWEKEVLQMWRNQRRPRRP